MTPRTRPALAALALAIGSLLAPGVHAGSFVYEGKLEDGAAAANGRYDFEILPYTDAALGGPVASAIRFEGVEVKDGRFRLDFELPAEDAGQLWLALAVRSHGSGAAYAAFPGRTKAVAAGPIGLCWSSTGDSNTDPAVNFLGTTDAQPLVLRAFNARSLRIEPSSITSGMPAVPITNNMIGGSHVNAALAGVRGATIAGGGSAVGADPSFPDAIENLVSDAYSSIGGGAGNQAGDFAGTSTDAAFSTIGGGRRNRASAVSATVAGGHYNEASGRGASIGGGENNVANTDQTTVGGGINNDASGLNSTVGGGSSNRATGFWSTIGGGRDNIAGAAGADYANVGGGTSNTAKGGASTVSGGSSNTAMGLGSTISGGSLNCAGGNFSWAGGRRAKTRPASDPGGTGSCSGLTYPGGLGDSGSFVWSDALEENDFVSTGANQFLIRARGGMAINTPIPRGTLTVTGTDKWNPTVGNGWGDFTVGDATRGLGVGVALSGGGAGAVRLWAKGGNEQIVFTNATQHPTSILSIGATGLVGVRRSASTNALEVEGSASKTTAGDWLANSDARIKTEVAPIENALDRLMRIRPVSFRYDEAYRAAHPDVGDRLYYNVIAQEYAEVFPEAVQGSGEYLPGAEKSAATEVLQVDFHPASVLTVAAVQELAARMERAERENHALKAELAELRAAVAALAREDNRLDPER